MKKIFKLGIVLSAAFILSACGLQTNSGSPNDTTTNSSPGMSLKDLLTKNTSQKCTWVSEDEGQKITAEIIVKGNKFKETIISNSDLGQMTTHAISDGEYVYTWSPAQGGQEAFAMKTKTTAEESTANQENLTEEDQTSQQIDLDAKHQLTCNPIDVSDNEFTPPSDIKFVDYEQFLQQIQSSYPVDLSQTSE